MHDKFRKQPPTPFETWLKGIAGGEATVKRVSSPAHLVRLLYNMAGISKAELLEEFARVVEAAEEGYEEAQRDLRNAREALDEVHNLPDD